MPTVSFVKGATTVEFPKGLTLPLGKTWTKNQVVAETDGGQVYVYSKGSVMDLVDVVLPGLSQALLDSLRSFWTTDANGKANAFTYNDELGVANTTARFWGEPKITQRGWHPAPWYTVTVPLRIG